MPWHHKQYWAVQSQELSIYVKWYADSCPYGPSTEAVIVGEGWNDKPFRGCSEVLEILSLSFLVHSPRTFIRIERWCFPSRGLEETLKGCHWSQDNSLTWRNIKLRALYRISVNIEMTIRTHITQSASEQKKPPHAGRQLPGWANIVICTWLFHFT